MERPEHCPICLDDLGNAEPLRVCGHFMHASCLAKHFKQECVICKTPQTDVKVTGQPPKPDYSLLDGTYQIHRTLDHVLPPLDLIYSSDDSLSTSSEDYPDEDLYHPSWD